MRAGRRMRRSFHPLFGLLLVVLLTACTLAGSAGPRPAEATPTEGPAVIDEPPRLENFDRALFDANSIKIDNQWWPLTPGTQFIYEGHSIEKDKDRSRPKKQPPAHLQGGVEDNLVGRLRRSSTPRLP